MVETDGEEITIRRKVTKAAAYLHRVMLEGNTKLVMLDLFGLGIMGQVVVLELHKRLTAEQQEALFDTMVETVATDGPRLQQRRALDALGRMHDHTYIARPPRSPRTGG